MARPKTRTSLLASAQERVNATVTDLQAIDLRTTRGDLRDLLKTSRETAAELSAHLYDALQEDAKTLSHPVVKSA